MLAFLSRDRIVASPGFNRWWMLLAALGINISIGQTLAFSVFNIPLTRVIGLTAPVAADWTLSTLGWVFTLTYVFLGLSAGVFGRWQDRAGPRASGVLAAMCFAGGFLVSALGVYWHQIWLLYVGYGVIGGCGAGIGFNTPVPTLMRWFPDRRGLATGIAVMGFGGGAILGGADVSDADGPLRVLDVDRGRRDVSVPWGGVLRADDRRGAPVPFAPRWVAARRARRQRNRSLGA